MLCTEIVSDIQNNFCTQHVLLMLRASEKDIPVCQNIVITQPYYLLYYKEKRGLGKHTNHRQACCVLLGIESQITTATVSSM